MSARKRTRARTGYPSYTVSKALPGWVERGRTQFQNAHGGPAELAKDVLFQMSTEGHSFDDLMKANGLFCGRLTPDVVWKWTTRYSDEFLNHMKALGKDIIQVTWSCGFSTESEAVQRKIVTEFARKARKKGIRICAYLSLTNIFWKDALEHEPELKEVAAKCSDGKARLYAYSQARYLACINQPAWLKYLKKKVRMALKEADVDALYFDNLSAECACYTCARLFSEFTKGLTGKRHKLPLIKQTFSRDVKGDDNQACENYLHRLFCARAIAEALKSIRGYAFRIKSPLLFSANNHLSPFVNDVCNVLYSQDTRMPGPLWSNIPLLRYLEADSGGWKPVVTNHPLGDADPRLSMAEAMAFQSYPYEITHRPYNLFYSRHPELFTGVRPMAKIGVILEWPKRRPRYLQPLGLNNLLYEVILPNKWSKEALNKCRVILLPDLETAGDDLCAALRDFAARGGSLFATERITPSLVERIRQASNPQYLDVDAPRLVAVNLVRKTDDSACILHVLNYSGRECGPMKIRMNIPGRAFTRAELFSPDESTGRKGLRFTLNSPVVLDRINVYSIVRLT